MQHFLPVGMLQYPQGAWKWDGLLTVHNLHTSQKGHGLWKEELRIISEEVMINYTLDI